jgi:DNA-directed RNA polymerase specialized sigma24 family protein
MRAWFARAAANTALRTEEPRTRFARWTARWFARTPSVPESWFQGPGEPYPRHWRRFPESWTDAELADPAVHEALADALDELPATWRAVVVARDALGEDAAAVCARLGLDVQQQRAVLNRARALLRQRLAERLPRGGAG